MPVRLFLGCLSALGDSGKKGQVARHASSNVFAKVVLRDLNVLIDCSYCSHWVQTQQKKIVRVKKKSEKKNKKKREVGENENNHTVNECENRTEVSMIPPFFKPNVWFGSNLYAVTLVIYSGPKTISSSPTSPTTARNKYKVNLKCFHGDCKSFPKQSLTGLTSTAHSGFPAGLSYW